MATVKEKPLIEEYDALEDNETFVLNWLSDAPLANKKYEVNEISTRLEDILDELQGHSEQNTMKIRLR